MQTFLPFSDFAQTAAVLDVRRLGKQRVEVLQILRALTFDDYGWRTHPAVTMWAGFPEALVAYGVAVTQQWIGEGFGDSVLPQLLEFNGAEPPRTQTELSDTGDLPPWVGWEPLHLSHRAALVRKDSAYYGPLFPGVDPNLPYVWPDTAPVQPHTGTVSAWVVRGSTEDVDAMRSEAFVGVRPTRDESAATPEGTSSRNTKRRRQIRTFVRDIDVGDRVVVPHGGNLLIGEIAGGYEWRPAAPRDLRHARPVRWLGTVHRSELARPVHLQDPRVVFALRDEPVVAAWY